MASSRITVASRNMPFFQTIMFWNDRLVNLDPQVLEDEAEAGGPEDNIDIVGHDIEDAKKARQDKPEPRTPGKHYN